MNIYLLLIDDARFFFYSTEHEADEPEEGENHDQIHESNAGVERSWKSRAVDRLRSRLDGVKNAWQHAEAGLLGHVRRWWDWLHTFIHPQESMLSRLYWVRRIDLYHPASRSTEIAAIWRGYLRGRFWHHVFWLSINATIVPIVAILAILPGPNFIGYWFTYRAIHHGLIVLGIRRARRGKLPTSLIASKSLDHPVQDDENGRASHPIFEQPHHHDRLHEYYRWASDRKAPFPSSPIRPREESPTGSNDPGDS